MPLNFDEFDEELQHKILSIFNYWSAVDIHYKTIDDPEHTTGGGSLFADYGIGFTISKYIFQHRQNFGGIFWSIDQLEEIPYFGQDKLRDIAFTVKDAIHNIIYKRDTKVFFLMRLIFFFNNFCISLPFSFPSL